LNLAAGAALLTAGLTAGGYLLSPPGVLTAQQRVAEKPAPREAMNHATALSEAFRNSADRVLPAVVAISNEPVARNVNRETRQRGERGDRSGARQRPQLPREFGELDPLLKRFFEQMPDGFGDGEGGSFGFEMPNTPRQSSGSGVIIDESGIILTNNHVVAGNGKVTVRLSDGREFVAKEVLTDPNTDIAVVRIETNAKLPAAKLGNSDELLIGDWVIAVGQPFGLEKTVTAGIISAKGRDISITKHAEFLQTDAAINPGNSGGPLVNLNGEVIGINTAISSSSGGFQGVGFAVPANVARWVSDQLLKDGKVHRAYVGIGIQPVTQELADQLEVATPGGALVTEVQPDSPAAAAGLKPQDVVVEFGGVAIHSPGQLSALASRSPIGSKQPVVVYRDGKRVTLNVNVREQPENYGVRPVSRDERENTAEEEAADFNQLGLEVSPLSGDVARELRLKNSDGVVITAVEEGSPADEAGLTTSMVIVQVGDTTVKSVEDFEAAVEKVEEGKGVLMLVRTAEGSRFVVVK
jgi:serine protease Do